VNGLFCDATLPTLPETSARIYQSQIDTRARLHRLKPADLVLADFAPPCDYFTRRSSAGPNSTVLRDPSSVPWKADRVAAATLPPQRECLVHGTFGWTT